MRKTMQTIGLVGGAVFLLLLREADSANVAVLLMCGALGIASFCISGFGTNHLDIAPKYAGVLMGITNTIGTIPGVVGVALTGWLVDTTGSYDSVFVMVASVKPGGHGGLAAVRKGREAGRLKPAPSRARGSALLVCSGNAVMAGPLRVYTRWATCKPDPVP